MRWVVTGGAGFIGSHFVRTALQQKWADSIVVLDALTYAGNLDNLQPVHNNPCFIFQHGDITAIDDVEKALAAGEHITTDAIFHFAAESHVDRSIVSATDFVHTNVTGTQVLLDAARKYRVGRFVHISTDEVYGSLDLGSNTRFTEQTPLCPTSPYAASKAASDLLVLAAHRTHDLDAIITRCSNNYGPYQFPEKFIPLFITNALDGKLLPLYGDGLNIRDWIHVDDHVEGIHRAFLHGKSGHVYNLGGNCERSNRALAEKIIALTHADANSLVAVTDRLAHDRRYAIDAAYAQQHLQFTPGPPIEQRLAETIDWYRSHRSWWESIKNGSYRHYYQMMYGNRPALQTTALAN